MTSINALDLSIKNTINLNLTLVLHESYISLQPAS